jgi:hypothetical protein
MNERTKLKIHGIFKEAEVQTKAIENLVSEIIAENFPTVGKEIDIKV